MARSRFKPNNHLEADLAADLGVRAALAGKATEAGEAARQIASTFAVTGFYEKSFVVDGTQLATTDPAGHMIEWGSVNNPPHGTLRRAAEQVGARVVDRG